MKTGLIVFFSYVLGVISMVILFFSLNVYIDTTLSLQSLVFDFITIGLGLYIAIIVNRNNSVKSNVAQLQIKRLDRYISSLTQMQQQVISGSISYHYVVSILKIQRSKLVKSICQKRCDGKLKKQQDAFSQDIHKKYSLLNSMLTDSTYGNKVGNPSSIKITNNLISISPQFIHEVNKQIDFCIDLIYDIQLVLNLQQK